MKSAIVQCVLGLTFAAGLPLSAVFAEEEAKATLPTLLIKGEVVSLDANDPNAVLLKVKDRYGFETPIFLSSVTKITQGGNTAAASSLSTGTAVEVEYNFDINTAKRHAVSVKAIAPTPVAAVTPTPMAAPAQPAAAVQPPAQPVAAQPATPATPAQEQAAPATQ